MRAWKVAAIVAVLVLVPILAGAQPPNPQQRGGRTDRGGQPGQNAQQPPPPHKWWQNPRTVADLGLTPDQSAHIEETFQATLPKLRASNSTLERREARLNQMITSDVSEAEIIRQIDLVESSRSELGKARTLMLFQMYRLLTPEQRVKLKALFDQFDRERRRPPGPPDAGRGIKR